MSTFYMPATLVVSCIPLEDDFCCMEMQLRGRLTCLNGGRLLKTRKRGNGCGKFKVIQQKFAI